MEQVLASGKFEGVPPQFTPEYVDDALSNLFVKDAESQMFGVARQRNRAGIRIWQVTAATPEALAPQMSRGRVIVCA